MRSKGAVGKSLESPAFERSRTLCNTLLPVPSSTLLRAWFLHVRASSLLYEGFCLGTGHIWLSSPCQ